MSWFRLLLFIGVLEVKLTKVLPAILMYTVYFRVEIGTKHVMHNKKFGVVHCDKTASRYTCVYTVTLYSSKTIITCNLRPDS